MSLTLMDTSNVTAVHIHGGPGGYASATAVLTEISSSISSYRNAEYPIPPESCGLLLTGNSYINVHTLANPNGAIQITIAC